MVMMESPSASPPPRDPRAGLADRGWGEWIWEHRKPWPGLERHTVPFRIFDPIPPETPRPALLLGNLVDGDVLPLERVEVPGCRSPDYIVRTLLGRDLGRLPWPVADVIEFSRTDGIAMEVSVAAAAPSLPPETALTLLLEAVVWCRAEDWFAHRSRFALEYPEWRDRLDGHL